MKNRVHADHLRHFNGLETNNEQKGALQDICVFDGQTLLRHISVKVIIENMASVITDAIVLLLDRNFDYVCGASRIILKLAGRERHSDAKNLVSNQGNLTHFVCRQVSFFRIQSTLCNALLPDLDESPGYVDTD
jgi:hypothetical protein